MRGTAGLTDVRLHDLGRPEPARDRRFAGPQARRDNGALRSLVGRSATAANDAIGARIAAAMSRRKEAVPDAGVTRLRRGVGSAHGG
jgi:hypothetical protein